MKREFVREGAGKVPAVVLCDPKYGHNVAGALRACAALGAAQLWVTGERAISEWEARGRLPREERMRDYQGVEVCLSDRPFDAYRHSGATIVGVEVVPSAEPLAWFEHPDDAVYVFGPEDGGLAKAERQHCHRFVILPAEHCLNLACAVNVTLADRRLQRQRAGIEPVLPSNATLAEQRGWLDSDEAFAWK